MGIPSVLERVIDAFRQANNDHAICHLRSCLDTHPTVLDGYYFLGMAYLLQGDADQAQEIWFSLLIDQEPDDVSLRLRTLAGILRLAGELHMGWGRYPTVVALYEQVVELCPEDAIAHACLGDALAQLGHLDAAIAQWQEATTLEPTLADVYQAEGEAHQRLEQWQEAIAAYRHVLALRPNDLDLAYQLAVCFIACHQFQDSLPLLQRITSLQPEHSAVWGDLAWVQMNLGNMEGAIACLHHLVQLEPGYFQWLVRRERSADSSKQSISLFNQLAQFVQTGGAENIWNCAVSLGRLLALQNHFRLAINCYRYASHLRALPSECQLQQVTWLIQVGDLNEAYEQCQNLLQASLCWAGTYGQLGHILSKWGQIHDAIAAYQKSLELDADQAEIWFYIGTLWAKQGNSDEAIASYSQAIQLDSTQSRFYLGRAIAYLNTYQTSTNDLGTAAYAQADLRMALDINPELATQVGTICQNASAADGLSDLTVPVGSPRHLQILSESWDIQVDAVFLMPLGEKQQVTLSEPGSLDTTLHFSFRFGACVKLPPGFVARIPNGRFWISPDQSATAVFTTDSQMITELSPDYPILSPGHPDKTAENHQVYHRQHLQAPARIEGKVAVLAGLSNDMYYHWLCDSLPRWALLQAAGVDLDDVDYVLVGDRHPFHQETLDMLGIPEEKMLSLSTYHHLQARELIVPSFQGTPAWPSPGGLAFVRELCLRKASQTCSYPKRIYISRQQASNRQLLNEAEIVDYLTQYQFQSINLENLSVQTQAEMLSQAEIVIAPHGGGLTNIIFCQPGTTIIELFSPNYVYPCYWYLANIMGLGYYYLEGNIPIGKRANRMIQSSGRIEDLYVPVGQIMQLLDTFKILN